MEWRQQNSGKVYQLMGTHAGKRGNLLLKTTKLHTNCALSHWKLCRNNIYVIPFRKLLLLRLIATIYSIVTLHGLNTGINNKIKVSHLLHSTDILEMIVSPGLILAWNVTCAEPSAVDKGPGEKFKFYQNNIHTKVEITASMIVYLISCFWMSYEN